MDNKGYYRVNMQDKINNLEEMLAHQANEIAELNEVVTTQGQEIDTLKKYIKIKLDKIENTMNDLGGEGEFKSISDEAAANKPPHY